MISSKNDKYNLDKANPAYIYLKELQRNKEINKRRTQTANYIKKQLIYQNYNNNFKNSVMFKPKLNPVHQKKKISNNHKKQLGIMSDPRNPYSIYWPNKFLEKKFNMEIGVKGFLNGVPIIDLKKKKEEKKERKKFDDYKSNNSKKNNNKKNKKKKNEDIEKENNENNDNENLNDNENKNEEEENEDENLNDEMDKMFNTNQKNFFKFRKDIKEGNLLLI